MLRTRDAPCYYVKLLPPGSAAQSIDVTQIVTSFEFHEHEGMADKLALDLDNFDLAVLDDPNWKKGTVLEVSWGYAGNMTPARQAVVTKIAGSLVLKVEALAKSILMNKLVKSRSFDNMTRAQVVQKIAEENGYGAQVQSIQDTGVVFPTIQQARMTDAAFLAHLARREGFQFYVDYSGLHFHERNLNAGAIRQYVYYRDPEQGDILHWNIENDVSAVPGRVRVQGRDPIEKKDIDVSGSNTDTDRAGVAPILEVVDPRTATSQDVALAQDTTLLSAAPSAAAAQREADGKFKLAQQSTVLLTVQLIGDPGVQAKKIVDIQGISKRLSGKYYVREVKHKLDAREYVTTIGVRSDGNHGGAAAGPAPSDASQNTKPDADPNALVPKEVVDPRTKQTSTQWVRGGDT